jgi:23S rRNA A2030 N6-methylase RlmJ
MFRVFDLYGSREHDQEALCALVASAADIEFEPHSSYYVGDYWMAPRTAGQKLRICSNELEDEDGKFYTQPKFPEYKTLLHAEEGFAELPRSTPALDELRERLGQIPGLVFLRRSPPATTRSW